jgi:hypothetical protein
MDILKQHEVFEMEVIDRMNSAKMLDSLVFGGGSMLRLCHELNRYSVDLDFWFVKKVSQDDLFLKSRQAFEKDYEMTDAQMKHFTMLFELRSPKYPSRLKIEIRRKVQDCDYQQNIAFSKFSTKQVVLKAHTLKQTMKNKIEAFLERGEIRDCFDIEFMARKGVEIPLRKEKESAVFLEKIAGLKERDFKLKLRSILENDIREYYVINRFRFLQDRLTNEKDAS